MQKKKRANRLVEASHHHAATIIQSMWRMKLGQKEVNHRRRRVIGVTMMQSLWRGYWTRREVSRRKKWAMTAPGPAKLQLGLELLEESKGRFSRHQKELDQLHVRQVRAFSPFFFFWKLLIKILDEKSEKKL